MPLAPLIPPTARATCQLDRTDTRLRGPLLHLARVGILGLALASIGFFFAMLPAIHTFLATPCTNGSCPLTPEQAKALSTLGLTPGDYATFTVALILIAAVPSLTAAAILFWRRSDDWVALVVAWQAANLSDSIVGATGIWQTPATLLHTCGVVVFYLTFTLFPSGRFVPHWERWFVLVWLAFNVAPFFVSLDSVPNWLIGPLYFLFYANLLFCQLYRYWRVSGPVERQQTKWVVFGLIVALLANIAYWQPYAFIPALSQPSSLYAPLFYQIYQLVFSLSITLSFGVAILRYRLWDIDAIINKTLVYGFLTGLLGALYAGLIIGLEHLAGLISRQANQPVVLVISTLAIFALFLPVRRRIQAFIDRRFYRKKYDAEQTLAAFSVTLRNEVDLEQIRAQLLAVVSETMQPSHVSLWLRQRERYPTEQAHRLDLRSQVPTRPSAN